MPKLFELLLVSADALLVELRLPPELGHARIRVGLCIRSHTLDLALKFRNLTAAFARLVLFCGDAVLERRKTLLILPPRVLSALGLLASDLEPTLRVRQLLGALAGGCDFAALLHAKKLSLQLNDGEA